MAEHGVWWRREGVIDSPIQHSRRAQGLVLTTSGGSTPTLRHRHSATLQVFIWEGGGGRRGGQARVSEQRREDGRWVKRRVRKKCTTNQP